MDLYSLFIIVFYLFLYFYVDLSYVTYGSMLKLRHVSTEYRLHSHEVSYGSGSKQQSVTAVAQGDDLNSFWVLKSPHGIDLPQG